MGTVSVEVTATPWMSGVLVSCFLYSPYLSTASPFLGAGSKPKHN